MRWRLLYFPNCIFKLLNNSFQRNGIWLRSNYFYQRFNVKIKMSILKKISLEVKSVSVTVSFRIILRLCRWWKSSCCRHSWDRNPLGRDAMDRMIFPWKITHAGSFKFQIFQMTSPPAGRAELESQYFIVDKAAERADVPVLLTKAASR